MMHHKLKCNYETGTCQVLSEFHPAQEVSLQHHCSLRSDYLAIVELKAPEDLSEMHKNRTPDWQSLSICSGLSTDLCT